MSLRALHGAMLITFGMLIGSLSTVIVFTQFGYRVAQDRSSEPAGPRSVGVPLPTSTAPASASNNNAVVAAGINGGASGAKVTVDDERTSFLCGHVDQEPYFVVVDEYNKERRPHTRPKHIWYRNGKKLSQVWQDIVESMQPNDFNFAYMGVMHAAEHFTSNATYYCGLVPQNSLPWSVTFRRYERWLADGRRSDVPARRAARYAAADVAFGVYTGQRFLRTRASAIRDTYLARHPPHRVFFYNGARDPLGLFDVVVADNAGEDYQSALKKQMFSLKHMWAAANDSKCDSYVVVDYLLTTLEAYDADQPHLIGCCPGTFDLKIVGREGSVYFPSGGGAILLSRGLMSKLVPTLDDFMENVWPKMQPQADVAIAYAVMRVGVKLEVANNMFGTNPEQALKHHHTGVEIENSVWHYVHPTKVFDMDEFYVHQQIDRMTGSMTDEASREFVAFVRHFVAAHFVARRRAYYETRTLALMVADEMTDSRFVLPFDKLEKSHADYMRWFCASRCAKKE